MQLGRARIGSPDSVFALGDKPAFAYRVPSRGQTISDTSKLANELCAPRYWEIFQSLSTLINPLRLVYSWPLAKRILPPSTHRDMPSTYA